MRSDTILEVVKRIEDYDLLGIDEDLNGRMFETFLNATVRGKELGQYFTPRSVVKYMVRTAQLKVEGNKLPLVVDACCGSGGFLIEALSELSTSIRNSSQLTNSDMVKLKQQLHVDTIYGIEANYEIGRIARLNMYLHGDGGSRIYVTGALDKDMESEPGLDNERQRQFKELKNQFLDEEIRFDVALSNPPFSMSYSNKIESENRILKQYKITEGKNTNSNVLFLERYRDLLSCRGELLTVIDDTVLNGVNSAKYRSFIRDNFIIRQVVSLPFNTFLRAEAGSKTSVLHLCRKQPGEKQGDIFMAITNNVGHDNYKKDTPHRDNLPDIVQHYLEWKNSANVPDVFVENQIEESLGCPMEVFVVPVDELKEHRLKTR